VLIVRPGGYGRQTTEVWRLAIEGDTWDFQGDDRVLQQLRELADRPVRTGGEDPEFF
jgi:hypothetical protein